MHTDPHTHLLIANQRVAAAHAARVPRRAPARRGALHRAGSSAAGVLRRATPARRPAPASPRRGAAILAE
jgi:hypothetical protein